MLTWKTMADDDPALMGDNALLATSRGMKLLKETKPVKNRANTCHLFKALRLKIMGQTVWLLLFCAFIGDYRI